MSQENGHCQTSPIDLIDPTDPIDPTDLRVLLFDIDGTLMVPTRRSFYRQQVKQSLIDIFGTAGIIDEINFSGKTDLQILSESLLVTGISLAEIKQMLPKIEHRFVAILCEMERTGKVFNCCPGIELLLTHLSHNPRYIISLLTGNVEPLAHKKLALTGLSHHFRFRGAFGSDNEDRCLLPAIAAERIGDSLGIKGLLPQQFIIIGDTPRDVACARYFGAKVIAVATGNFPYEELARTEPDFLFQDFNALEEVLTVFAAI